MKSVVLALTIFHISCSFTPGEKPYSMKAEDLEEKCAIKIPYLKTYAQDNGKVFMIADLKNNKPVGEETVRVKFWIKGFDAYIQLKQMTKLNSYYDVILNGWKRTRSRITYENRDKTTVLHSVYHTALTSNSFYTKFELVVTKGWYKNCCDLRILIVSPYS